MHQSKKRYRVGVWGRQSGKSTWANNELAKCSWETEDQLYWFLSPTYQQAKGQYRRLVSALFDSPETMLKKNQTELRVKMRTMSSIEYKSGESFDNLRGATISGSIIDEFRDQHKDLWPLVIRPMLTTTQGWAAFTGTPNGYDHFFDLYNYAKQHPDDWDVFHHPSTINPLFTLKEYEAARSSMSDKQFRQEILAEFLDLMAGKAYWAFTDANLSREPPWGHDPATKVNPDLPMILGMDFNLNPMAWVLGQSNNVKWHWLKEQYIEHSNTQEAALAMCVLLDGYRRAGVLRAHPQLRVVGDAAGKAGQRAAMGRSDFDILFGLLHEHGFSYEDETPDSNPAVRDRINAVNAKCKAADGTVYMTVDPVDCPRLVRCLQRTAWKDGTSFLDKNRDTSLTHSSDAIGYPISRLTPIKGANDQVGLTVITW
jgi:hypothetical protein